MKINANSHRQRKLYDSDFSTNLTASSSRRFLRRYRSRFHKLWHNDISWGSRTGNFSTFWYCNLQGMQKQLSTDQYYWCYWHVHVQTRKQMV